MADTSLEIKRVSQDKTTGAYTQVHAQHRIQLTAQTVMVVGQGALFRHVNPDDYMWTGDGDRHLDVFIPFTISFRRAPIVLVNLVGVDASHAQNLRLKLRVRDTRRDGFTATAHTWQDTKLASVDVSWFALEHSSASSPAWVAASHHQHAPS